MTTESYNANPLVTIGTTVDVWIVLLLVLMLGLSIALIWGHFAAKTK